MKTLLNYGADAKKSQMTSQLFYKDKGGNNSAIESTNSVTGTNYGLTARGNFIKKSKELTMSGPLYEDVFGMNRHLINGVDLTLKLYRSSPAFCLMSGKAKQEYTIELLDAYLQICKLKVNPALILAHNTLFQNNSNALYPFTKSEVKVNSIPVSQLTHPIANCNCYIVGFVESKSLNGAYEGNPFNFQSSMLKTVSLYVNGVSVPGRPTRADDVNSYVNMFDGAGLWRENQGNCISREEFLLGNALFVFELEEVCGESEYLNLVKSGNVRLEIEFKTALTQTLSCIILSERNSIIEIYQARNVFIK
ncbi:uncharacterized protein F54H12.2-like [Haliotis rubra]|uniref:uncharacterized protein F54H12.2-like n=1 Tax=Haliotis rubra TaxID=36100 RepID=UPI001EE60D2D|nr:uncharacterized protein F54H12.2-like [Haliotis rubra]